MTKNKKSPEIKDPLDGIDDALDKVDRMIQEEMRRMLKAVGTNPDANIVDGNETIN
jgi:hypothetical protein